MPPSTGLARTVFKSSSLVTGPKNQDEVSSVDLDVKYKPSSNPPSSVNEQNEMYSHVALFIYFILFFC